MTLTLNDYQQTAFETDVLKDNKEDISLPLLGLFGEAGGLLSALKKHQRDGAAFSNYEAVITEELGDCLWYLANICSRANLRFNDLGFSISRGKQPKTGAESRILDFHDLQAIATTNSIAKNLTDRKVLLILGANVGKVLGLANDGKSSSDLQGALQEVLHAIAAAAAQAKVSLATAAAKNIEKIQSRWPKEQIYRPLLDESALPHEQLPRKIEVTFIERKAAGKTKYVVQQCKGLNIGDRLTDNNVKDDDYRFHDVFHLSYAAFLGWSPVIRALFKVKRKSEPDVDEIQDGARAILIEEGISTWIFNRAHHDLKLFQGADSVDYSLLKTVHDFTTGYEVENSYLWQWEKSILEGFRVFRELKKHRGGTVIANLETHTLEYRKPI